MRVEYRLYVCTVCGHTKQIQTNHLGSCFDYCHGCSWKPSFGEGVPMFGRTFRKFVYDTRTPEQIKNSRVWLFAVTYVNKDGMRTLFRANQGRNHFPTLEAAEIWFQAVSNNNSNDILEEYPNREIRPVLCYPHGDAVGVYFD